ncbi:MAG: hypothetical protein KI792_01695 [Alphaproteobacteria bacterium]|nr:hypothetical protein [Alphaproteobacteria bacterium SS10]
MGTARHLILALALLAITPWQAMAADPSSVKTGDTIALALKFEEWAEPKSALVTARIGVVTQQNQAGLIQARMKAVSEAASNHAAWRLARLQPAAGARGAALWQGIMETRMTPDELGRMEIALRDYRNGAGEASFAIERIDFSPTLAEKQAVRAALRAQAYHQAARELQQLNSAFPDKRYRIASISFSDDEAQDFLNAPLSQILGDAAARPRAVTSPRREGEASHIMLTAHIVLTSEPLPEEDAALATTGTNREQAALNNR